MAANMRVSLQLLIFFEINSAKWKSNIIQQKNSGRFTLMLQGLMPVIVMVSTIRIIAICLKNFIAKEKYIQRTEMQMRNALLKLRFLYLDRISGYFNKTHEVKQVDGRLIFNDSFAFGINWGWWNPNEHWGNAKDADNPYIIWLQEQVVWSPNGIKLITDLNTGKEPGIKSGQICLWKTIYRAFGRYRILAKVPPNGGQYWFAGWLIGKECAEEIDIFEMMDEDSKGFTVTLHGWVKEEKKIVFSRHFRLTVDLSEAFHLYEVDWKPDHVAWYFDGIKLCEYKGKYIPTCPMGLIINNGVVRGFKPDSVTKEKLAELFPAYGEVMEVEIGE